MPNLKPKMLVISMISALDKPATEGLKFVLFQIKAKDYMQGFEYGFANWNGSAWDEVDSSATVFMWGEVPNPKILF